MEVGRYGFKNGNRLPILSPFGEDNTKSGFGRISIGIQLEGSAISTLGAVQLVLLLITVSK